MAKRAFVTVFGSLGLAVACGGSTQSTPCPSAPVASASAAGPVTAKDAETFVREVDKEMRRLRTWATRAAWVNKNFITEDTDALAAQADEANMEFLSRVIPQSTQFDGLKLDPSIRRQLDLLKLTSPLPAPKDAQKRSELALLAVQMESAYGKGKYCPPKGSKLADPKDPAKCLTLDDLSRAMATQRDWDANLEAWKAWHDVAKPLRAPYERFVALGNEGAKEIGFVDLGALWRSGYDMPPDDFEKDTDRLWSEVKPLYDQLHCFARARLRAKYGKDKIAEKAPIPAHLLGNMWAQDWAHVYDVLRPYEGQPSLDVTAAMKAAKWDEIKVVKTAEAFYTSLGIDSLPETFWKRSLFKRPADREVVCHASAWDVEGNDDLRIKMCVEVKEEDLLVAHHELGHVYYYHHYYKLPILFQDGANDGFHEAIGDTMALSVTPAYQKKLGLIPKVPDNPKAEINVLMKMALQKIAFLPFGKMIDQWRWDVFRGKTPPAKYNEAWWALRAKYQGVAPPVARSESDFDPGAKYHVPANTPYMRYFLAHIYQFQFHRALCKAAGHDGPLHTCSIAGSKAAGEKLRAMLAMGASKPWPDAMEALTGERKGDATALLEYFAPLRKWLEEQNKNEQCGW